MEFTLTLSNVLLGGGVGLATGVILAVITAVMSDFSNMDVMDYKPNRAFQYMLVAFGVLSGAFLVCIGWAWWTIPLVSLGFIVALCAITIIYWFITNRLHKRR